MRNFTDISLHRLNYFYPFYKLYYSQYIIKYKIFRFILEELQPLLIRCFGYHNFYWVIFCSFFKEYLSNTFLQSVYLVILQPSFIVARLCAPVIIQIFLQLIPLNNLFQVTFCYFYKSMFACSWLSNQQVFTSGIVASTKV